MTVYQNQINKTVLPFMVYALTFSLFLGTAVFTLVIALTIIMWLFSGEYATKYSIIKDNPVVIAALLLFFAITLGLFWSHVAWSEKLPMYMKYHKLLYIPMIASIIQTPVQRRHAINAFLIVSLIILFISYGKLMGLIPFHDENMGYIVTRNRIAHNIFMAFAAFLMIHRTIQKRGSYQWVWGALSLLAIFNVMMMVNGRTGQVILAAFIALTIWQYLGFKSIKYLVLVGFLGLVAFKTVPMFEQSRLAAVSTELKDRNSSSGLRMGFYQNSIQIIKKHPLFGVGTGGFPATYQAQVAADPGLKVTPNPHNQYLLMWAEIGLVGLILFLYFLWSAWRLSTQLVFEDRCMIQGLVLLFSLGSLFNSLLLDAGEGRFYCTLIAILVGGLNIKKP